MDQSKKRTSTVEQFQYLGRWVDKSYFRAFVYDKNGQQKLANNYNEFESLTDSGIWFASKPEPEASNGRKRKDGIIQSDS
ncbi:hypothetical protein UFOVP265_58 [uncultured Caudovirales phage]|uniref:Uncharacterized protein n=1 Tax=uncultured Caudovirales phage TaxID=2100421 RepID=A0A6J5LIG8_9CAUD|nr:hypothetical protein UFOVP265_58 [uncultured Caudovirales phage]